MRVNGLRLPVPMLQRPLGTAAASAVVSVTLASDCSAIPELIKAELSPSPSSSTSKDSAGCVYICVCVCIFMSVCVVCV